MRVIAGIAKGRKLQTIEGFNTRPTTDRIKETLFNMIAFDLPNAEFLDLFSGSGAIGIEALSRGATQAVFVEADAKALQIVRDNLSHTKLEDKASVMPMSVSEALLALEKKNAAFDIIFMDPPYEAGLTEPTLTQILKGNLLKEDGYIIVERSSKIPLTPIAGLRVLREKEYRTTVLTFLCLEEME